MRYSLYIAVLITFFLAVAGLCFAYTDVPEGAEYSQAVEYVSDLGVAKGYDDGTFKPDKKVSRAEFAKMVVTAAGVEGVAENCFKDVPKGQWFAPYVCYLKSDGVVSGRDGKFAPADKINAVEAAKIVTKLLGDEVQEGGQYWYSPFVQYLAENHYLPSSIKYSNQDISRAQTAQMILRMLEKISDRPSVDAEVFANSFCQSSGEDIPANIDMERVRSTWLGWYNEVRGNLGLPSYVYNVQLNRSAIAWSETAEKRGYIDHKRPGQAAYYDYGIIKNWFKNLGLEFQNLSGDTFTENINWGYYSCPGGDCTQGLIDGVRSGFDFFMSERGKAYSPHYDSIVNNHFKEIGLGIAVDPAKKKYYLTVHYGTAITSDPLAVCE